MMRQATEAATEAAALRREWTSAEASPYCPQARPRRDHAVGEALARLGWGGAEGIADVEVTSARLESPLRKERVHGNARARGPCAAQGGVPCTRHRCDAEGTRSAPPESPNRTSGSRGDEDARRTRPRGRSAPARGLANSAHMAKNMGRLR
eukprot:scaffold9294_cov121-Isochrysis_galbana.AAC.1